MTRLFLNDENEKKRQEVLEWITKLEDYCNTYKKWPKSSVRQENDQYLEAKKLQSWLYRSKYLGDKSEFLYTTIVNDSGEKVIDILDSLYKKFGNADIWNIVTQIENYCNTYKEWPKEYKKPKNDKEKWAYSLSRWLRSHNYNNKDMEFRYANIINGDGIKLKDVLDNLYKKYNLIVENDNIKKQVSVNEQKLADILKESDEEILPELENILFKSIFERNYIYTIDHVKDMVRLLKLYCEYYKEWPFVSEKYLPKRKMLSQQLYSWLYKSGYNRENRTFKYINVVDDNGVSIKKIIDNLYERYGRVSLRSDEYVLNKVKEIQNFSLTYGHFPSSKVVMSAEYYKLERNLADWLRGSNYNVYGKEFKYTHVVDERGISVKDILDLIYAIYSKENSDNIDEDLETLNIWQAKDSNNVSLVMYYYVVKIMNSVINDQVDFVNYYKEMLANLLINYNINLNVEQLVYILSNGSLEEKIKYFYDNYRLNSLENNYELALLFKNLYNYSTVFQDNFKR